MDPSTTKTGVALLELLNYVREIGDTEVAQRAEAICAQYIGRRKTNPPKNV